MSSSISLTPYLCLHSFIYWINHSIGYSIPLEEFKDKVMLIHRMQDLLVEFGMHLVLFVHSMVSLFTVFNPMYLLNNHVESSHIITSQYALEFIYYTFDIFKMIVTPSSKMKKDYLFHHSISLILLIASYYTNYTHIGLMTTILLNSTNLSYDYFTYNYLTHNLVGQWISNGLFWLSFAHLRLYTMFLMVIKPMMMNVFNPAYSFSKKMVFIPTMSSLYGLQFVWFYKLSKLFLRNTLLLVSRPDILVHVPNGILYMLDRQLITMKQMIRENALEPPPMPEGLEELLANLYNWEKVIKEHLVEKEPELGSESELETESESESETEEDIIKRLSSESRHAFEQTPIPMLTPVLSTMSSEIQEEKEDIIENIHEDILQQNKEITSHPFEILKDLVTSFKETIGQDKKDN
jgi:hypothetical protein